ncbi:MAG: type IV toxin-antitoxin system AbiEi family antitoxin domain-containing protein, partial [Actinomycetota bacterium]|nr:type IV toxin-antitoxin system AbiEi family antitoxin domain-containing protein [Actinomycetota bacterium]
QHSLITTAQLRESGLTQRQITRRHQQGAMERIRHSVYRLAGGPVTWIQAIHAAALAAGADAVVSHETAAACWQFRHADRYRGQLHLTAHHQVRLPGVIGHTIALGPGDTTLHDGVPITTPERTIVDLAGTLALRELGQCLDDAIRRQLVNLERLRRLVAAAAARGGRRLLRPLHRLLAERLPGYRPGSNDWERDMDRLWDKLGLEPGVRQYRVKIKGRTYFLDRALPDLKIGAEYNGHEHHHLRSDRDHDAQRAAELSADGWHIITFTSSTKPETLRDAVSRIVTDRRRWMKPSEPDKTPS